MLIFFFKQKTAYEIPLRLVGWEMCIRDSEAGVPVTLIQSAPLTRAHDPWWRGNLSRGALSRVSRLLVPDTASRIEALRQGIAPARIEVTGQLAPIRRVLPCNGREYEALLAQLRNRHIWLAAGIPLAEAQAVINAHLAVLAYRHRSLLIVAPLRPSDEPALSAMIEDAAVSYTHLRAHET